MTTPFKPNTEIPQPLITLAFAVAQWVEDHDDAQLELSWRRFRQAYAEAGAQALANIAGRGPS